MQLLPDEVSLFFHLHRWLMFYVNQKLQAIPDQIPTVREYAALSAEQRYEVHQAFLKRQDLLQTFADENPGGFSSDELDIVRSWKNLVHGDFYVLKQYQNYMVFLSSERPSVAYGVLALSQPFHELIGNQLPTMVKTILLPFKGRIIYDGLISGYSISFGPGVRRSLNENFREAKARYGIVTSLPKPNAPLPAAAPKAAPVPKKPTKDDVAAAVSDVIAMTDLFCSKYLNEEYAAMCRALAEKMGRKRPSPLLRGKPQAWAAGIVRAIGIVNFLQDPSQTPHMRSGDIDAAFGIGASTGTAKQSAILKMFKMHQFDPEWTLPGKLDDNPMVWMIQVNGFMMDVRSAPREFQEAAFNKGLIPYIPADRK